MAARALDVARIQRVVNTCWLSRRLGQIPASAEQKGERGRDRGRERESAERTTSSPSECHHRSSIPSAGNWSSASTSGKLSAAG